MEVFTDIWKIFYTDIWQFSIEALHTLILSIIKQKGESQNRGNKKAKHAKFSEKRTFLTPWYAHVRGLRRP